MEYLLLKTPNFALKCSTYHTSCLLNGWRQSGTAMKKALGATKKKKIYFEESPKMPSPELFGKGSFEGKQSGNPRRVTVLNKLFMRHITDQLASGSCAEEIVGLGVEINRVKVMRDYKLLKVYWLAKGTASDEVVENILKKNAGLIRHELSQLRLMGVVPVIQFVKDKHYAQIVELDNKLAVADFGEDHTPVDPAEKLKTEFQIFAPLDDAVKRQLEELDKLQIEDSEELPLPPMPQNVLGLNHADILNRVRTSKKKSEALHRNVLNEADEDESWAAFKVNQPVNADPVQLGDNHSQKEAFREFLQKRQILQMKSRREKNYIPDVEYMKEELRNRHLESLNKFDLSEQVEEDFIEEDFK